jgi:hypothetical protein
MRITSTLSAQSQLTLSIQHPHSKLSVLSVPFSQLDCYISFFVLLFYVVSSYFGIN